MRERLGRLLPILPIDGWSLSILLWTALFGIVMRAWRIVDFLWGTDDWADLAWLPRSVGVDLAFAILTWGACGLLVWPLSRARRPLRWLARAWSIVVLGAVLFFGVANALSFRLSGSALTLHRLRGDDGATTRDMDKFAWADVWPILLLAAVSLASLVTALVLAGRFERWSAARRRALAASIVGAGVVSFAVYTAVWDGRDRGYGRHPVGVFVESVQQEWAEQPAFLRDFKPQAPTTEGYAAVMRPEAPLSPAPPAPRRATATTKNTIVFLSEGVPLKHTSLAASGPATTPRLRARADREGLVVERFYSPFHKSIQALFALFCGEFPTPNGTSISELNPRIDCNEMSEVMKKAGVHSGVFHGGYFSFYDKTSFLGDRGNEAFMDAPAIRDAVAPPPGTARWMENSWGIDDRAMVRAFFAWIDALPPGERFSAVLIPITAHYPFDVPPDVPMPFTAGRKVDRFWNAVHFLDIVFDELMQGLEQRGLLHETLVVFTADHGESPQEPPRESNVDRAMYEYDVRVPFVMFQRSMFPTAERSARLASIVDILPTTLDLMGIPDVRARQGLSFMADGWWERRVFLGASRSNVRQVGFVDGNQKFILDMRTGRTELYDLARDPDELTNTSDAHADQVARFRDVALTWARWQLQRITEWPSMDELVNAQLQLGRDFTVTVSDLSGQRSVCEPDDARAGTARRCPGFPDNTFAGVERMRMLGAWRMCMPVRVPPGGGAVELEVTERDYFRFVTNMRFALGTGRLQTDGTVTVRMTVDDGPEMVMNISKNWRNRRMMFGAPRHRLRLRVESKTDVAPAPVCLFFGDPAFRPKGAMFAELLAPNARGNAEDAEDAEDAAGADDDTQDGAQDRVDPR